MLSNTGAKSHTTPTVHSALSQAVGKKGESKEGADRGTAAIGRVAGGEQTTATAAPGKSDEREEKLKGPEAVVTGAGSEQVSADTTTGSDSKEAPLGTTELSSDSLAPSNAYTLPPGILPPDFNCGIDQPGVFVDANYHVMYKEYNLRRTRTFLTAIKPGTSKAVAESEQTKNLPEKRERSEDDSVDATVAAKRLKTDAADVVSVEVGKTGKPEAPVKTSPHMSGRGRKPSLSKSQRRRKRVCRVGRGGNENGTEKLCCLCSRKDSASQLGFLYGPYKPISVDSSATGGALVEGEGNVDAPPPSASLWVHEDCSVWAPGVCIARGKLLGLHEAVEDGQALVGG